MITGTSRLRIFAPDAPEATALETVRKRERAGEIPRPGFDFPTRLRGTTEHFHVFYNPVSGEIGAHHAGAVLEVCERDYHIIQGYFGGIVPARVPFKVIITPGIGGAYHHGCAGTDLYCADSANTDFINMLVVAEEVEVFAAAQGSGWDCETTNGEALSRALAEALYPDAAIPIAARWLNSERPDYITTNERSPLPNGEPADGDQISNACGVLFLNWLHYQLGYSWDSIVQAGAPSLGQTYTKLTMGQTDAFERFTSFMQTHFPEGTPVSPSLTNNPFPLAETGRPDVEHIDVKSDDVGHTDVKSADVELKPADEGHVDMLYPDLSLPMVIMSAPVFYMRALTYLGSEFLRASSRILFPFTEPPSPTFPTTQRADKPDKEAE